MSDQYALMDEYFRLRAEKMRLAEEFRNLLEPLQSRMREIEARLDGGCDSNCTTCPSQVTEHAPLAIRVPKGRVLN